MGWIAKGCLGAIVLVGLAYLASSYYTANASRTSDTTISFGRPEVLSGIPFKAGSPVLVRVHVKNDGPATARKLTFHLDLSTRKLPTAVGTEDVIWNSHIAALGDSGERNDLGSGEDRYLDAVLAPEKAALLNDKDSRLYLVGSASYEDAKGPLATEVCFYYQGNGPWFRCVRHNPVGIAN